MYPTQPPNSNAVQPKAPLRSTSVSNALDQNNQNLLQGLERLENAISRLGYNFPKDTKADGPKPVPMGAFGDFEEKIQATSSMLARFHDMLTVFEGFI